MGKLRDRMLVDLQLCGAKPSTQRTYLREAENLAKYFHKSPEQLGEDELKAYLPYLMKERHLSEGTFRFYMAGLKFLYRTTLKREWAVQKIRYPRARRKLPVVLDLSEVQSLVSVTKNHRQKTMTSRLTSSSEGSCFMSCPLAMPEYATSACWQTENVKTPSPYVVRFSEERKPQPN